MDDQTPPAGSTAPARSRIRLVPAGVAVVLVGLVGGGAALAVAMTSHGPGQAPSGPHTIATIEATIPSDLAEGETLAYPPIETEVMAWLDRLQLAVMSDPDYGTTAISLDRTTVTVTWFGEPSATLREHLDAAPDGITVLVHAAAFPPAELQQLVVQAMGEGFLPGVQIAMGGVENDGSGIDFGVAEMPEGSTLEQLAADIAAALQRPDVPVRVEESGPVIPISG